MARGAELARVALGAQNAEQIFVGVAEFFAMTVGEIVDFLEKELQRFRVAVRQEHAPEDVAEELRDVFVLVHLARCPRGKVPGARGR